MKGNEAARTALKIAAVLLLLYFFLVSINLMQSAFRLFGEDFAEKLFTLSGNKFIGLFVGILTTALVQSSSFTTSVVVGLVGGGMLDIGAAIPIIMGANIGTSVTNSLVAHGHIARKDEFRRATEGALIHDILNLLVVLVVFPLEMMFGILEKTAIAATNLFGEIGGTEFASPLKAIVQPATHFVTDLVTKLVHAPAAVEATILLFITMLLLFGSLYLIVKVLKSLVLSRVESFFSTYIFRNGVLALSMGLIITSLVQSSSVTTSLIVPMAAAGILTLEQIFPYTLGANVGTTVTAILASLATISTGNMGGVTIAFSHLIFNIFGILIFYPLRFIPIGLAREMGRRTMENRFFPFLYIIMVFFYIPGVCIYLSEYGLTPVAGLLLLFPPSLFVLFKVISKTVRKRSS
jgi:sodium-dependent phosphate cotransporter